MKYRAAGNVIRIRPRTKKRPKPFSTFTAWDIERMTSDLSREAAPVVNAMLRALRDYVKPLRIPLVQGDISHVDVEGSMLTFYIADEFPPAYAELLVRWLDQAYRDVMAAAELKSSGARRLMVNRCGPFIAVAAFHQGAHLSPTHRRCEPALAAYELEWHISCLRDARKIPGELAVRMLDLIDETAMRPKRSGSKTAAELAIPRRLISIQ